MEEDGESEEDDNVETQEIEDEDLENESKKGWKDLIDSNLNKHRCLHGE